MFGSTRSMTMSYWSWSMKSCSTSWSLRSWSWSMTTNRWTSSNWSSNWNWSYWRYWDPVMSAKRNQGSQSKTELRPGP